MFGLKVDSLDRISIKCNESHVLNQNDWDHFVDLVDVELVQFYKKIDDSVKFEKFREIHEHLKKISLEINDDEIKI